MSSLKNLSIEALIASTKSLVSQEREILNQVLEHLEEIERRRLYARLGFSSLFEYCTKELGYSESAAQRRISSMRISRELPQLKAKITEGSLNLTTLSLAQTFFRKEKTDFKKSYTQAEKHQIISTLENKSKRQIEEKLIELRHGFEIPCDRRKLIAPELTEVKIHFNKTQMRDINRLRELRPDFKTDQQLFSWLIHRTLKQIEPMRIKSISNEPVSSEPVSNDLEKNYQIGYQIESTPRKYISIHYRNLIWRRAQGRCEYVSSISEKRCEATSGLQIDHIKPLGMGGGSGVNNLRLLCQSHNLLEAIDVFGKGKVEKMMSAKVDRTFVNEARA